MEKFRQKRSKITSIADRSSSDRFYSAERAHREGQIVFLFFLHFHFLCFFSLCLVTEKSKKHILKNEKFYIHFLFESRAVHLN